jgi:diguanylate cyclase (GGDEF)-like protein
VGEIDLSPLAVSVQAAGTLLLALMLAQLGRVSTRQYAKRWSLGWTLFFMGLASVRLYIATLEPTTWALYLMFQWGFLVLLWSGCRDLAQRKAITLNRMAWGFPVAAVIAALLTRFIPTFNRLFTIEAAIVVFGALLSFAALGAVEKDRRQRGWLTMRIALVGLIVVYGAYVPLYWLHEHRKPIPILAYSSLADLLVSILLGFGMILVTAEETNFQLRGALEELGAARNRLERKVNTDPLTSALSRHAFHAMQRGDDVAADQLAGVVLMIDIDNLKKINDRDGHAVGDAVIRAAANAIRGRIRADDLLFRWGGDEFVAIVPNSTLEVVERRLAALGDGITTRTVAGEIVEFGLSWGAAEFGPDHQLDEAIRSADAAMYAARARRKI